MFCELALHKRVYEPVRGLNVKLSITRVKHLQTHQLVNMTMSKLLKITTALSIIVSKATCQVRADGMSSTSLRVSISPRWWPSEREAMREPMKACNASFGKVKQVANTNCQSDTASIDCHSLRIIYLERYERNSQQITYWNIPREGVAISG
jgi:hypothetical protein